MFIGRNVRYDCVYWKDVRYDCVYWKDVRYDCVYFVNYTTRNNDRPPYHKL